MKNIDDKIAQKNFGDIPLRDLCHIFSFYRTCLIDAHSDRHIDTGFHQYDIISGVVLLKGSDRARTLATPIYETSYSFDAGSFRKILCRPA